MKVAEKLKMNKDELIENGPITIVAFGDSVTHGALNFNEINYETVYWNRLAKRLNEIRNYVPVNVINAGIGATTAADGVRRMEKQVLTHLPDLVIVCFGLNDVNRSLEDYLGALSEIFDTCKARDIDTVFMSPNMLNTYVTDTVPTGYREYANKTAEMQNGGKMDLYINSACDLARKKGITVCDCYSEWKKLSKTTDTTLLLANGINHPTKEMHSLFSDMLFECIFGDTAVAKPLSDNTMYKN